MAAIEAAACEKYEKKLKNMLLRMAVDKRKKSPFSKVDSSLLDIDHSAASMSVADEIDFLASISIESDKHLKSLMPPEVRKFHWKYSVGLFKLLCELFHKQDELAFQILVRGGLAIGLCGAPWSWSAHVRKRKPMSSEPLPANFEDFAARVPPAKWTDAELDEVLKQTLEECEYEAVLRHVRCRGPLTVEEAREQGWADSHVWHRKGIQQKSKIRMIDPALGANDRSCMERSPPMATPSQILASAHVMKDPSKRELNVVSLTRRTVKKGRKFELLFEEAFLRLVEDGTPIPPELLKPVFESKGAHQCREEDEPSAKRRKAEAVNAMIDIVMVIVDAYKAYNQICINPAHRRYNRFAAWDRKAGRWLLFEGLVLLFGNVHSVVDWCRISWALQFIARGLLLLLLSVYVDDFSGPVPRPFGAIAVEIMRKLFTTLGFPFHDKKVKFGSVIEILGLIFDVANDAPFFFVSLSRKNEISSMIDKALSSSSLSISDANRLHGKTMFILASLVDRMCNPLLKPLSSYINMPDNVPRVFSEKLAICLRSVKDLINLPLSKTTKFEDPKEDSVTMYTDASFQHKSGWLCAVLVDGAAVRLIKMPIKQDQTNPVSCKHPINLLEIIAPSFGLLHFGEQLKGRLIRVAIDNDSAKDGLLNQNSPSKPMALGALCFWSLASTTDMVAWVDRAPTDFNPSDIGTRPEFLEYVLRNYPNFFTSIETVSEECITNVIALARQHDVSKFLSGAITQESMTVFADADSLADF
eukprot:g6698.t1